MKSSDLNGELCASMQIPIGFKGEQATEFVMSIDSFNI